jgi:hypothetical protein
MSTFPFAKTPDARQFLANVVTALTRFCGHTEAEATRMTLEYWHGVSDIETDDPLLYHECAYYYAMCIAHHPTIGDGLQRWEQDIKYWPPPKDWATITTGCSPQG